MVVPEHITRELIERVRRRRDGTAVLEGDALIAHAHRQVALCFIDMCDFTLLSAALGAEDVVRFLGEFFTLLDELSDKYPTVTKIKTIGDSYFAVAGLSTPAARRSGSSSSDDVSEATALAERAAACANVQALVAFCIEAQALIAQHRFRGPATDRMRDALAHDRTEQRRALARLEELFDADDGSFRIRLRIGIHCGDVVAGIVGKKQPVSRVFMCVCYLIGAYV